MKPSILFLKFPFSSSFGGGEKHTLSLCQALVKEGIPFYLLSSCPTLISSFKQHHYPVSKLILGKDPVSKLSIVTFFFRAPFIFLLLCAYLLYFKLSKKITVIYCLTLTEKLLIPPIAKLLSINVIFMEHTSIKRWLTKNPYRFLYKLWSNFASIVCVSESVKNELLEMNIKNERIFVIYNGVDTSVFKPRSYSDTKQNIYIKSPNMFTVGTVSRLNEEKGITVLIQAAKIAYEYIPNLKILIIGSGPEKEQLLWLAKHLEVEHIVQFVGFKDNISIWLSNLDVFVLPSLTRESFGIALAEAMACGIPVIASNIGGIPELVLHKQTGILVKPGDANQLASELIYLSQDKPQLLKMGMRGRKRIEEHFDFKFMYQKYLDLFKEHANKN